MANKQSPLFLLSFATELGFSLIAPLIVFIGLGLLADSKLRTGPYGITIGIVLGFVISLYMLYKSIKPYLKK